MNFVDHGARLLKRLTEGPNPFDGDIDSEVNFLHNLVDQLQDISAMRRVIHEDSASRAIEFGPEFWVMVDLLIDALFWLGYTV